MGRERCTFVLVVLLVCLATTWIWADGLCDLGMNASASQLVSSRTLQKTQACCEQVELAQTRYCRMLIELRAESKAGGESLRNEARKLHGAAKIGADIATLSGKGRAVMADVLKKHPKLLALMVSDDVRDRYTAYTYLAEQEASVTLAPVLANGISDSRTSVRTLVVEAAAKWKSVPRPMATAIMEWFLQRLPWAYTHWDLRLTQQARTERDFARRCLYVLMDADKAELVEALLWILDPNVADADELLFWLPLLQEMRSTRLVGNLEQFLQSERTVAVYRVESEPPRRLLVCDIALSAILRMARQFPGEYGMVLLDSDWGEIWGFENRAARAKAIAKYRRLAKAKSSRINE